MVYVQVYFKRLISLILLLSFFFHLANAQDDLKETLNQSINCLVDLDLEQVTNEPFKDDYILLFKTEQSCIPCYREMKEHFEENYPDHPVYIVFIMDENYFKIEGELSAVRTYYPHPTNFFFLFKEEGALKCESGKNLGLTKEWISSPSPYFLVVTAGDLEWFGLEETMEIVKERGFDMSEF